MTVTFPNVGKNRRWSVAKREPNPYDYHSRFDFPYWVRLEEMVRKTMFGHEVWERIENTMVKDLETDTLLKAAAVIVERTAKSDWEKSRLGTYPPKTLEK